MKLLHIDSSITGGASASRQVSAAIVAALAQTHPGLEIVSRDLDADPIPHLDFARLASVRQSPPDAPAPTTADTEANGAILQQFLDADAVVIGAPMYNFTVPSQLKAWLDRILVPGKTFSYSESGPVGLAGDKRVIVATARGGAYQPGQPNALFDFQEPYLRAVFAFIGVEDVEFVRAEGLALGPEPRQAAIEAALGRAEALAGVPALSKAA